MSEQTKNQSNAFRLAAGAVLGAALLLGLGPSRGNNTLVIGLSDFATSLWQYGFLDLLKVILVIAFLRSGASRTVLLIAAVASFLYWLARYSLSGAFLPQDILNCLFLVAIASLDRDQLTKRRQEYASYFFSFIFLAAALQKVNSAYLSGDELTAEYGFLGYLHFYLGQLPDVWTKTILTPLSIILEFAIGIGLLWRPKLFAHLATIFVLAISLVHPPALFVYLTSFALTVLIDDDFVKSIESKKMGGVLRSPFSWVFARLFFSKFAITGKMAMVSWAFYGAASLALILIHVKQALRIPKETPVQFGFSLWKQERLPLAFFALCVATIVVFKFFGPSPLGFSMFSAQKYRMPSYDLRIMDKEICRKFGWQLDINPVSDVRFAKRGDACVLSVPTSAGRDQAIQHVCRQFSGVNYEVRKSDQENWEPGLGCDEVCK